MKDIKTLEELIVKHKTLYYQGKPEISDFEYDQLEEDLRKLDPKNTVLKMVGSAHFSSDKVAHDKKMLSLNKTYKVDELVSWMGKEEIVSTFKIDGSSCSIIYEDGLLKIAKTRGDGKFGENITNKVLLVPHVPKQLESKFTAEVRGEIYCTEEKFIQLSRHMVKMGLEKPSSQRNIVAGILGRKENIELSKFLSFQAFELITEDAKFTKESEKFKTLIDLGFETPEYHIHKTKKDIEQRLQETQEFMTEGEYLIDGLVFTYNNVQKHQELGYTAHHPRYKMAFKFQGEVKQTTIKNLAWQVSRNGILTPVANVEPVEVSGAKVSRVTLHNFGMVRENELKKGDKIEIVRSGEVIPKFLRVITESKEEFIYPTQCPSCGEKVYEEDIRLICKNSTCPDKIKDEILNFIKKIGIEDLSSKRLEELIRVGMVKDIPSLYAIKREDLLKLDKVKDKLADKLIATIEKSKEVDLITFLSSLGITGGAYNKCEKVVQAGFDSVEKILKMKVKDLETVESFAEKSATDFINSVQSKDKIIKKLIAYGFKFKSGPAVVVDSPVKGLKFCITGTLSMKRSELQKIVKENGGIVQSSVSKETDYLITNDVESGSSKFKKAKSLEIPIISEEKFFNLLK